MNVPDDDTDVIHVTDEEPEAPASPVERLWRKLRSPAVAFTYGGLVLIACGFGLTAYTWGRVAGLLSVPLQLPYLISGGLTSIGLVVVGAVLVSLATGRREAEKRELLLMELSDVLRSIEAALREDDD